MSPQDKAALFIKRFSGRRDVYARKWYDKESGRGNYSPVCAKFWTAPCHLKLKDGTFCGSCKIKEYVPVSPESVMKHINGDEEHAIYVIREDGHIEMGALDFDCKPGKDPKNSYYFDEIKKTSDVCDELGIKHGIARSTTDGFHIYFFFDNPYPAEKFLAVIRDLVFERTGFNMNNQLSIKMLPELFPKQSTPGGIDGIGNAIKPPMIETRWMTERNCWVNKENVMIPADQQWEYFAKIPNNNAQIFDELIKTYDIDVKASKNVFSGAKKLQFKNGGTYDKETGEWKEPTDGSVHCLLEGCAAFKRLREKMDTGYQPGHEEGFALFHTAALQLRDGMKYFEDGKVPGWAENDKHWRQLTQSSEHNYSPWTCKKMQEKGVCTQGTKCFNKTPPSETVSGQIFINHDAPENEWIEPSPVRYGKNVGGRDAYLEKLVKDIDAIPMDMPADKQGTIIREVVATSMIFDQSQRAILKQHIKKKGILKPREVDKIFSEAARERVEETGKILDRRSDMIKVDGTTYRKNNPYGYSVGRMSKQGDMQWTDLCSFDVWIREVKTVLEEGEARETVMRGIVAYDGLEKAFEIKTDEWFDGTELMKKLGFLIDIRMTILRSNLEDARIAWQNFSMKDKYDRIVTYSTQGWYEEAYIMPTVIVDKLGVRANTEKPVEVVKGDFAHHLGFKYLSETETREILFHMKAELFNAFPRGPLFIGLAHTLLAPLLGPLNIKVKPTLWYEGLTGRGKTSMTKIFQHFYGVFPVFQNWTGTEKGMLDYCYRFKDTVLVIDDYKQKDIAQIRAAETTIQYGYDGTQRSALTKSGTQRGDRGSRCLLICSGEDTPFGEASIISRMILVPYPKMEAETTKDAYEKCVDMQENYCGVTPRFLHYCLNQDMLAVRRDMRQVTSELLTPVRERLNAPRICEHFAMNFIVWKLFMGHMFQEGILDKSEMDKLLAEHWGYVRQYRDIVITRCSAEQQGVLALDILKELINSARVSILGLSGYEHQNTKVLGFVKPSEPDLVYLYPGVVLSEVKREVAYANKTLSQRAIGEQLIADGIIVDHDTNQHTKMIVDPGLSREENRQVSKRVWVVKISKLGFDVGKPRVVKSEPLDLPQPLIEGGLI